MILHMNPYSFQIEIDILACTFLHVVVMRNQSYGFPKLSDKIATHVAAQWTFHSKASFAILCHM